MDELPLGWTWATPDQVAASVPNAITIGPFGSDLKVVDYREAGVPLVFVREIRAGRFGDGRTKFVDERKATALARHYVRPGDVLITKMGDPPGDTALYPTERPPAIITADCIKMTPNVSVTTPAYLVNCLRSEVVRGQIVERAAGVAQQKISLERFRTIRIPLAPLPEQKRIADKLDALLTRVDACRERLDRVPGILKRFRQSVLAAATSGELTRDWREEWGIGTDVQSFEFDDADVFRDYTFPASWTARRLSDIADITGGVTKDSKKQSADFVELPYLRVANVQRGFIDLSEVKTIRVPPERVDSLLLRAGDLLFNEGGDIDKLGRGWIWNDELPRCVFQNHVFRGRLLQRDFEPRYFSWYGNSRGFPYFLARGKQTTNLASINKSVLSALPVAEPPVDEQHEIVRRVSDLLQFTVQLERGCSVAAKRVETLTPSALAKAFRGELVPQDAHDETATELLARLGHAGSGAPSAGALKRTRQKAS